MKEGVDKLAPSVYFVKQKPSACTCDIISYAPRLILLTDAVFFHVLYYIV